MKTTPMSHQAEALRLMDGKQAFGLFMEQGTGKTWTLLADAERLYMRGLIDAIFVVAPKGVHTNWIKREIPTHLEGNILARAWTKGGGTRAKRKMEALFEPREEGDVPPLRVFSINIDALLTKDGFTFARRFLAVTRAVFVVDESTRIKNPAAARTIAVMRLRPMVEWARIATGTPITKSPVDVFAQMEFLQSGLLGTTSYRAFVAEYSELMSMDSPMMKRMVSRNPKAAYAQIVARDEDGTPKWRNLEKLQKLLAPHVYRILKKECLDLPEKIFKVHPFELGAKQRAVYDYLDQELRIELGDLENLDTRRVQKLAAMVKLQQITSGFVVPPRRPTLPGQPPEPPGELIYISDENPRLDALKDLLEDLDGQMIIWARFREELAAIARMLAKAGVTHVQYHGGVRDADREEAVDAFQAGRARVFLGQPQSGGIGLTLTAAETVIYYSNDFNLETRLQSEDRAHRIGTRHNVVYIDLIAENTIDLRIATSLQQKMELAAEILGDRERTEATDN